MVGGADADGAHQTISDTTQAILDRTQTILDRELTILDRKTDCGMINSRPVKCQF